MNLWISGDACKEKGEDLGVRVSGHLDSPPKAKVKW